MSQIDDFEVQVLRDGRWVTDSARSSEAAARQLAKQFLKRKDCAGARVVATKTFRDGSIGEEILFERTREVSGEKPVRIIPQDAAPLICQSARDFFSLESRMLMNRMLRIYFEGAMLTPTEVLHSERDLQRLMDKDSLVPSAVSHIAKLQTTGRDQTARARQDELYAVLDQIAKQTRQAENSELPKLTGRFSETLAQVSGIRGNTPEYLAMVVLARDLAGINSWVGKLDRLCKLALDETDERAVLLIDTVIADVLGANVVQEILGWKNSLADAIISMLDLSEGTFDTQQSDAKDTVDLLNELLAKGALPGTRHVILDKAMRQLKSSQPLYKMEPEKEMGEYRRILTRLTRPAGLLSGARAAEALTVRGTRFIEQGGATGRRAAIGATLKALPDRARGIMYLGELSTTEFAAGHIDDIVAQLDAVFGARVIDQLCRKSMSPKDRMVAATGAYTVAENSALPDKVKVQLTQHIDGVLERYLLDEDIIEKLDKPEDHIRDRAVRLVKFCGAGVLPEGRAMKLARERIVKLLRQPQFEVNFVEGISDPKVAEKALRDFHGLLVKAGIA